MVTWEDEEERNDEKGMRILFRYLVDRNILYHMVQHNCTLKVGEFYCM